ncbi:Hypothetical predicted protein [Mytilus galloprovincialis]|nr:Hypothetical predicted protein [Mytilus galloprovincialis]
MGDLNGRIGDKQDFNELIDVGDIQKRLSIDNVSNKFGDYLLDFLSDSKTCILNGRFKQNKDNFTCVAPRGKSVIDYIIVPHTQFKQIQDFETTLVTDCIKNYNLNVGTATIPDHSILSCKLKISRYETIQIAKNKNTISREKPTNNADLQNRRYLTNVIPIDMFSNQRTAHAIENVIDRLQNSHVIQTEIDEIYSEFVDLVQSEMNEKLNYKVKNNENFKESRKDFDKKARQAERQYNAKQRDKITSLKTNDPKTFWDEINKLGPTTTKQEIDCVNLENGSVSYNPDDILKKWKEDFSGLFNDTELNQISDEFLESTRKLIQEWEEQMDSLKPELNNIQNEQTRNESELILNSDITLTEVTDALKDAKTNKATETENDMQNMLDTLHSWSEKWQLKMNIDKTKIMHCRKASMKPTDKTFNIGHQTIDLCKSYRYLGFEICETVEFTKGVKLLHEAGGRALGAMISKHFSIKGLSFPVYEKLYYNTVVPVADYASEIWGLKKYDFADKLQSRAARTFLGVGKRAPIPYLTGETCWMEVQLRHHLNMIRLWARIINMSSNRLPKIAYLSEKEKNRRNSWALEIKTILGKCDLLNHYNMSSLLGMSNKNFLGLVKHRLTTIAAENWKAECAGMPKLRTYVKIKSDYCQEPTLLKTLSTKKRAVLSKLRSGTFPIEIEKGRYRQLPVERRICKLCTKQAIEDEIHFVIKCPAYDQERQTMFNIANQKLTIDLQELSDEEQFKTLLTSPESICAVANYLTVSLDVRSAKY